MLVGAKTPLFASLIAIKLHDGIEPTDSADASLSLVDKMAQLCVSYMEKGSYALLDAYYAAAPLLKVFREAELHLISRVRISTVAHAPLRRLSGSQRSGSASQMGRSNQIARAI